MNDPSARAFVVAVVLALLACKASKPETESAAESATPSTVSTEEAPAEQPRSPLGGLWEGRFDSQVLKGKVVGVITETGEARFVSEYGAHIYGTVKGKSPQGELTVFLNHQKRDTIEVTGTVEPQKTLSGSYEGARERGKFSFAYSDVYERPAALPLVAGTWKEGAFSMTVQPDGSIEARDPASGCKLDGALSIVDARFNAYRAKVGVTGCQLAGDYSGFVALDDDEKKNDQLVYGISSKARAFSGFLSRS